MRIVSLLPSATEIVYLLGLGPDLVGVTHECDWPADAASKPRVTGSRLPAGATPAEIDALVSAAASGGSGTYHLDRAAIAELAPDLILTQDLCAVCAVPAGHLAAALATLDVASDVVSLSPSTLEDVLAGILNVGEATGRSVQAHAVVEELRARVGRVRTSQAVVPRRRVLALEWGDPLWGAGQWVPEMVEIAGGDPVLATAGSPSRRLSWDEVARARPDVVVYMPCGYHLDAACEQARALLERQRLGSCSVIVADAAGYFSRPGPRLVDGLEALAAALRGEEPDRDVLERLR